MATQFRDAFHDGGVALSHDFLLLAARVFVSLLRGHFAIELFTVLAQLLGFVLARHHLVADAFEFGDRLTLRERCGFLELGVELGVDVPAFDVGQDAHDLGGGTQPCCSADCIANALDAGADVLHAVFFALHGRKSLGFDAALFGLDGVIGRRLVLEQLGCDAPGLGVDLLAAFERRRLDLDAFLFERDEKEIAAYAELASKFLAEVTVEVNEIQAMRIAA